MQLVNPSDVLRQNLHTVPKLKQSIALVGNPNSGKTTIYNNLTGTHQHVGNYPGVTVEKKYGFCHYKGRNFTIVDLPGTYSLFSNSTDEEITTRYLSNENPDLVINIVDASNLERNLYLTLQMLELGVPLIIILNMSDIAIKSGIKIDIEKLSTMLGVPVIQTIGHKKIGMEEVLEAISQHQKNNQMKIIKIYFENEVEGAIKRYSYIAGICQQVVSKVEIKKRTFSDILDSILTHRIYGIPIFLGLMWLVFHFSFTMSATPMAWLDSSIGWLGNSVSALIPDGLLQSLVVDGIIGGVGGILSFVPIIMFLFLSIAILEDSGYMARAAFISDRFMNKIGLHGKSFIPLLLGFGCGVPAVLATRTLSSRRDRLITILIIPLMSCGARLPVYTLLIASFFPEARAGHTLFGIYILGVVVAIFMAKLFQRFIFMGDSSHFILELPQYKIPTLQSTLIQMWEKTRTYLKRAATVLLAASLIIWGLCNFPKPKDLPPGLDSGEIAKIRLENSFAGKIGHLLVKPLEPIGLGDWKVGVALFSGFTAKEVVVSTFGVLYSLGAEPSEESQSLRTSLRSDPFFTPLRVLSLLVFVLLYLPCIALLVVIGKETGSVGWSFFTAGYLTTIAWIGSFVVYQGGLLLGFV